MRIVGNIVVFMVTVLAGCSDRVGPGDERYLAVIAGFSDADPRLELPDTVRAGESFRVEIVTYGGGCDWKGETEVEVNAGVATVTPYDYTDRNAAGCTRVLKEFRHVARVRFDAPVTGRIVLRGREARSGEIRMVERSVTVR